MAVLAGRVAVVTGASTGIGAGLAAMLAAEGAQVVLAARGAAGLEQVAMGIRRDGGTAIPVVTDLTDDDSLAILLARTRAELGPVDVLVNNAGHAVWKPLEATSMAEWDRTFAVNVRAAAWLCAAVLPGMQARGFGRIINIGSEAGVAIVPGLAAYCYVIPGADPASFLTVDQVVDVARFLLHTGDNVKLGPEILVRTMRNPMTS